MKSTLTLTLSVVTLLSSPIFAQLSFGGQPYGIKQTVELIDAPVATMPAVDAEAMLAEDADRTAQGIKGPFRFGFNHSTELSLENSGVWQTLSNGDRVWRIGIDCPGAYSINLEFHDYVIPQGAQVFLYNELGHVLGGFEEGSNPGMGILGVTQLAGERITVEYVEPIAVRGLGRLMIGQVTHAYRDVMNMERGLGDSGACNNNVICPVSDAWRDQIRSVAMIMVGGSGFCTGQLINNCEEDGTPYFLTANHCLGGNPGGWLFRFNWESPSCTANQNGPNNFNVSGASLLTSNNVSDLALLELNGTPPSVFGVYYTGWDKTTVAPTSTTCIHHPSGDVKKISFDTDPATYANIDAGNGPADCWRIATWEDGTTESGSSGSGLWNQNGLLVGQLYGGQASCSNSINDFFGRFSVSYPFLEHWLGDCGNQLGGYDPALVSVNEITSDIKLDIVPNPSNGQVTITIPNNFVNVHTLTIHDAIGQLVLTERIRAGINRINADLGDLTEGVYIMQVNGAGARALERIVIAR